MRRRQVLRSVYRCEPSGSQRKESAERAAQGVWYLFERIRRPAQETPRSNFVTAFEYFWNEWASGQDNIMLIACGSASGWIQDHFIDSPGGFYGRSNTDIHLPPFTLQESEQLLEYHDIQLSRYDIAELYMVVGGIPYYLNLTAPGESVAQTIDRLFFKKKCKLDDEFNRLFNSIFVKGEASRAVIRLLATRHSGYSREDIIKKTGLVLGIPPSRLRRWQIRDCRAGPQ